jgi:hypothetical protein
MTMMNDIVVQRHHVGQERTNENCNQYVTFPFTQLDLFCGYHETLRIIRNIQPGAFGQPLLAFGRCKTKEKKDFAGSEFDAPPQLNPSSDCCRRIRSSISQRYLVAVCLRATNRRISSE